MGNLVGGRVGGGVGCRVGADVPPGTGCGVGYRVPCEDKQKYEMESIKYHPVYVPTDTHHAELIDGDFQHFTEHLFFQKEFLCNFIQPQSSSFEKWSIGLGIRMII